MEKKNFNEGPLYTITNYIYWFSFSNLYFMLSNILLILFLLLPEADPNPAYYTIFFIVMIPVGPSFTALLSVMGKVIREGDVSVTKDYFKAYKQNFKQSLGTWIIQLLIISIVLVDINFFAKRQGGSVIIALLYAIALVVLIMGLYIYPILSRFYMKTRDVFKLSFYFAFKKFNITILNIISIAAAAILVGKFTGIAIFFFASVVCYLIMYYERNILKEIEEKVMISTEIIDSKLEENSNIQ